MADLVDLPAGVANMYQQFAIQGAQRQSDGAAALAEFTRLDYLSNKNTVSFAQGTGQRIVDESGSGRARQLDNTAQPTSSSKPA